MILWKLFSVAILTLLSGKCASGKIEKWAMVPVNEHSETGTALDNLLETENLNNYKNILFRQIRSLKDISYELEPAEGRHKNRKQSYNYHSKPKRTQYNNHNRHSDQHHGKGAYHKTDSYDSNSGYSTNSNYNRARKGDYGDEDHKKYGGKRGNSYGGKGHGGNSYGGKSGGSGGYHGGSEGRYSSGHGGSGGHRQGHGGHYGGGGGGHSDHYGDDSNSYLDSGGYH